MYMQTKELDKTIGFNNEKVTELASTPILLDLNLAKSVFTVVLIQCAQNAKILLNFFLATTWMWSELIVHVQPALLWLCLFTKNIYLFVVYTEYVPNKPSCKYHDFISLKVLSRFSTSVCEPSCQIVESSSWMIYFRIIYFMDSIFHGW